MSAFTKVKDARGHGIRGLWQRNGRFYLQMRVPGQKSQAKIPLQDERGNPVETAPQAKVVAERLLALRRGNDLPVLKKTPTLGEWIDTYLSFCRRTEAKKPDTISREKSSLDNWKERFGTIRLAHFRRTHVNEFIAWRKEAGQIGNRTINVDIICLNNCLNHAIHEGRLSKLPTDGWKPLEHVSPRRPLWTEAQIDLVCQKAAEVGENGDLLADYVRFMAFSGTRRNEALNVKWSDINWERKTVYVGTTKYGHPRDVDFNEKLEAHLKAMLGRRCADAEWLFPSPLGQDGNGARNLQGSLETARNAAGLPEFQYHDLRHYFISSCVMAGIDYMTIARWVGHKDGGVLIGRVYGHLNDAHTKKQAGRLFGTTIEQKAIDTGGLLLQIQQQNALIAKILAA